MDKTDKFLKMIMDEIEKKIKDGLNGFVWKKQNKNSLNVCDKTVYKMPKDNILNRFLVKLTVRCKQDIGPFLELHADLCLNDLLQSV